MHLLVWKCLTNTSNNFITDCTKFNAELDVYRGADRCITTNEAAYGVDEDSRRVTVCTTLYGSHASLIVLPENNTELWNFVVGFLQS